MTSGFFFPSLNTLHASMRYEMQEITMADLPDNNIIPERQAQLHISYTLKCVHSLQQLKGTISRN